MIALYLIVTLWVHICSSTSIETTNCLPNRAKLYSATNFRGHSKELDLSSCVSHFDNAFDFDIASIDTMGSCAMVYSDYQCHGNKSLVEVSNTRNPSTYTYGFTIDSLGPCRADCSAPTFENGKTNVTISGHSGTEEQFTLITGECRNFQNVSALINGIIRLSESLCIQMYEEESCKGSSKPFQDFSKYKSIHENTSGEDETVYDEPTKSYEILPEKWQHSKSISLCDFNCIGTKGSVLPPTASVPNVTGGTYTRPPSDPPTQSGHVLVWMTLIVVFLSIVGAAEVFRRYRNFKQQNPSSTEFTNFLSQSNREESL